VGFIIVVHSLPLEQLLPLRFPANSVKHSTQHEHQSEEARCGHLMAVQDTGKSDAEKNSCRHDESEYNRAEILDSRRVKQN
jgi:hypothetical protein